MPSFGADDATSHPSPLLRRPGWSLDGTWSFAADGTHHDRTIEVPYAPEAPASGVGTGGWYERVAYRRELDLERPAHGSRVLLHFGAVDRIARVLVGGHLVGTHEGGYDPFVVDITDHVAERGSTTVVVEADDDPSDLDAPRGKQDWLAEPHGIWYPRTSGIWRTVWLERVPTTRVAELDWRCDLADLTVTLRARVAGPVPTGLTTRLRLSAGGRVVAEAATAVAMPDVELTVRVGDGGFDDRHALVWWPFRPLLLDAEVALLAADGTVVDEVRSYTALRSAAVQDGTFRLNGRPYWLRLALDQGYWRETGLTPPGTAALRHDVELARSLGFNGVRKHQKTEDPRWFAWADRLGVVAWVEMPSAYRAGPVASERLLAEWSRVVRAYRNHPSVVAWVPVNESWGVPAVAGDRRQRALVEAMAATACALDASGRPVSANDGWETVGGDIVGVHDYTQDAAVLAERFATEADVDAVVTDGLPSGQLVDLDRRPAGGRAVVLSEFGGIALDDGGGTWGYQVVATPEELLARYRDLWAAAHASDRLAGACWTQLTDTYQEANGLVRMDRTPKLPPGDLAAATNGLAT